MSNHTLCLESNESNQLALAYICVKHCAAMVTASTMKLCLFLFAIHADSPSDDNFRLHLL